MTQVIKLLPTNIEGKNNRILFVLKEK